MNKTDITEDPKVEFKSNRKNFSCQVECKKSDKYIFDSNQIDDSEEEIIDTTHKSKTQSKNILE